VLDGVEVVGHGRASLSHRPMAGRQATVDRTDDGR
jgi:hypothetical protein